MKIPSPQLLYFPYLQNRDARISFGFRSYANCRVTSFKPIFFLFLPLPPISLTLLDATLMDHPASVANKRFTIPAKSFRCNTYKKHGGRVQTRPARRNSTEGMKLSARHHDPRRLAAELTWNRT